VRISTILRNKGDDVTTIDPGATLQAACDLLSERRIGAVLVLDANGRPVGVLSERDVVRAIAQHGADALAMTVRERMSSPVQTCHPGDGIDRIMAFMTEHRIRHLPVLEDGRLIGIVSIGDVVKLRVDTLESETRALTEYITTGR
jgi:CBS domain-containing protein